MDVFGRETQNLILFPSAEHPTAGCRNPGVAVVMVLSVCSFRMDGKLSAGGYCNLCSLFVDFQELRDTKVTSKYPVSWNQV